MKRRRKRIPKEISKRLPAFKKTGDLASWLELDFRELDWLANWIHSDHDSASSSKHYRSTWVRKRSGGWRLIESPKALLKSVQRQILDGILNYVLPHPLAFGFVPGKNIVDFAKPHMNRDVCVKFDLADFFHSVTVGRVFGWFRSAGFDRDICRYLTLLTTVQTNCDAAYLRHPLNSVVPYDKTYRRLAIRHLPQGAPTSPALANLCAFRLDVRLAALARKIGGVHYSRYADDLLFSGSSKLGRGTSRFSAIVGSIVLEEGFELNYRKTRVMRSHQRQKAGGIVLNAGLNFDRRDYDRLKAILHNCVRFGLASQNKDSLEHFREHLLGKIQWVEQLNPERGRKLRETFNRIPDRAD